jgi:hypothetical protein
VGRYFTWICLLFVTSWPLGLQAQPNFVNKVEMQLAKLAFPDNNFVDLKRKTTYSVQKSDDAEWPFYWKIEEDIERIAISNQNYFQYVQFLTDFNKDEKANFTLVHDKEKLMMRPEARVQMAESEGMFHTNFRYKYYNIGIQRVGAILNIRASKILTSYAHLSDVSFSTGTPALEVEIVFEIPNNLEIRFDSLHFDQAKVSYKQIAGKKETKHVFTRKMVPAASGGTMAPSSIYFEPHILLYQKSFTDKSGKKIKLLEDVNDMYRWNTAMVKRTKNETKTLQGLVDSLTRDKSEEDKLRSLYYWVQDNIRYLAFEDGLAAFVPDACQEVYFKRYGDCKGKANLLKQMLILAGFDARLVWIGTRDHSFIKMSEPILGAANHMITAVKWEDKWLFLDPTLSFYGIKQTPDQLQGKTAMVEGEKAPIIETLPVEDINKHHESSKLILALDESADVLVGNQYRYYSGNPASSLRYYMFNYSKKDIKEIRKNILTNNSLNVGYANEKFEIDEDRETPIHFESEVSVSNQVMKYDNQLLLPATIYSRMNGRSISEKRKAAVSFGERINFNDTLVYQIPTGYVVDYLPENLDVKRDKYSFTTTVTQKGNQIELICSVKVHDFILLKSEFEQWNKDFAQLNTFNKNRIVLEKK